MPGRRTLTVPDPEDMAMVERDGKIVVVFITPAAELEVSLAPERAERLRGMLGRRLKAKRQ